MIGFLVKKAFFDTWDNMLSVFLMNFGFVLVVGGGLYLPYLLSFNVWASYVGVAVAIFVFNFYVGASSLTARDMVDYKAPSFRDFFGYFRDVWKTSVAMSVVTIVQAVVLFIAFPFYLTMGGLLGVAAMAIIFWVSVVWWIASQYYYPVRARLDTNIKKIFKKSFVLFFDNTVFSIVLTIGTILIFAVSGFTAFLLPGLTAILIWHQGGLKLRLHKYDYLEKNEDAKPTRIPWDALLIEEKDRVGPRTLRGMIFPWKE